VGEETFMRKPWVALCCAIVLGTASVAAAAPCSYRMQAFSEGTTSCQSGTQFRCVGGSWQNVGTQCADGDPGDAGVRVDPGVNQPKVREPGVREPSVQQPGAPTEPRVP
jgi:hypothetical protein